MKNLCYYWTTLWSAAVVQLLSCVQLFATPWTAACQASLSSTISWSLHKLRVGDAIQPSHPLPPPSPFAFNLFQHQGLFQRVSCEPNDIFLYPVSLHWYRLLASFFLVRVHMDPPQFYSWLLATHSPPSSRSDFQGTWNQISFPFIYLGALGFSCDIQGLHCGLRALDCVSSVAGTLSLVAMQHVGS